MKYFMERTGKDHIATAKAVIQYLESIGIKAERKGIYSDIEVLNKFGLRILKSGRGFYYEAG